MTTHDPNLYRRRDDMSAVVSRWDRHGIVAIAEANRMRECWWISRVRVRDNLRGQHHGSDVLTELLTLIDRPVVVVPGGYGSDPERLRRFYERHGFVGCEDPPFGGWHMRLG